MVNKKDFNLSIFLACAYTFVLIIPVMFFWQKRSYVGEVESTISTNIPVIPGISGFGVNTPAGRGGVIYKVTNLNDSGTGSLRWAVSQTGPRIIIFEVSGEIKLLSNVVVRNPYITIAGQTAPKPGIELTGATLTIATNDVLVQHLRVRPGDSLSGPPGTNRDSLEMIPSGDKIANNIVIDHCTFNWSIDENISTWYGVGDITVNQSIIAEPLDNSIHVDEGVTDGKTDAHGFNFITGSGNSTARLAIVGSLFAHSRERNPLSDSPNLVFVNNVVYNTIQHMTDLRNERGFSSNNSIVGNVYIDGPSRASWNSAKPIVISGEFYDKSKIYLSNNYFLTSILANQWEGVTNQSSFGNDILKSENPPIWIDGFIARKTENNNVLNWVLNNVGARPVERDVVETRIINDTKNRGGKIKNTVVEAGGWPVYQNNTRVLTLPEDPNGDKDNDGYTNIEEWLHSYSYIVEGNIIPTPTPTLKPTITPTKVPTPTSIPTLKPTIVPTLKPTIVPTLKPSPVVTSIPVPVSTPIPIINTVKYKAEFWNYSNGFYITIPLYKSPAFTTTVNAINFNWGYSSPNSRIKADKFIARFTSVQQMEGGKYVFTTTSDDGVKLYIDDKLVIDNWTKHSPQMDDAYVYLLSGEHKIRLEYFEYQGQAVVRMGIKKL